MQTNQRRRTRKSPDVNNLAEILERARIARDIIHRETSDMLAINRELKEKARQLLQGTNQIAYRLKLQVTKRNKA